MQRLEKRIYEEGEDELDYGDHVDEDTAHLAQPDDVRQYSTAITYVTPADLNRAAPERKSAEPDLPSLSERLGAKRDSKADHSRRESHEDIKSQESNKRPKQDDHRHPVNSGNHYSPVPKAPEVHYCTAWNSKKNVILLT
jgi:hypothetical protein